MKTNRFSEGATKQYLIFYSMQGVLKINGRYLKQIDSENWVILDGQIHVRRTQNQKDTKSSNWSVKYKQHNDKCWAR